ncbi:TraB/GumN family protein [Herbaspirillum sp. alder98]|uniref:TraB/GumN family protein n=1 Tax=Herbaspirillum sp. alder98 TaxID=2913096 RepID=UPI001CD90F1B|nr:TraB/GumN family protein [Herbaspirillum sp. alder98]MCA1325783.1 TraB/GumN family protein [Herbaspirillum sp. alder98]
MYFQIDNTTVRVLGSIHLFPANVPEVPRWARDAYAWADELVFETDWGAIGDEFTLPQGQSLSDHVPKNVWEWLVAHWPAELGELHRTPAWLVFMQLGKVGAKTKHGIDVQFRDLAVKDGKDIRYLETPVEFADSMRSVPSEDVLLALNEAISSIGDNDKGIKGMFSDWNKRDLDTMFRRVQKKTIITVPSLRRAALTGRNENWLGAMHELCKSERKVLVVVGGLHLHGEGNLLQLLERAIERL